MNTKEYVNKAYGSTQEQLKIKLENLKTIIEILESESTDIDKACEIYKIYNNSKKFISTYSLIEKYGKSDPNFKGYIEYIAMAYQKIVTYEEKGYFEIAKTKSKLNIYLDNYVYATEVITDFIQSDNSYKGLTYLEEQGISKKDFDFCVKTIAKLDPELTKKYEEKVKSNVVQGYTENIKACLDIAQVIKSGYFLDGTPFEWLEFWRRIPFVKNLGAVEEFKEYSKINPKIVRATTFSSRLDSFIKATLPAEHDLIMNFMKENKIGRPTYVSELDIRSLNHGARRFVKYDTDDNGNKIIVQDVVVDNEDLQNMFKYMKVTKLPFIYEVFKLVEKKYIDGEISLEELNELEKNNTYSRKQK